jgi:hypothetical protein
MNSSELIDYIRSGPAALHLDKPLRFRRRTWLNWRFNPCDFDELLRALQSSKTIQDVFCGSHLELGITEDEWVRLVKTIGRIRCIQSLGLMCQAGSCDFRLFQAVADAVNAAGSLHVLVIHLGDQVFREASSGLTALANALRQHTALRDFTWFDYIPRLEAVTHFPDLVLQALPACPYLLQVSIRTRCASAGAIKGLLQLPEDTDLTLGLTLPCWLEVADGIREGQCNMKHLSLALLQSSNSETTEAVEAIASAIQLDRNLESINLQLLTSDFEDEAAVALAEALTVNKTLHKITLYLHHTSLAQDVDVLNAIAYDAFSAMLRVNTGLVLDFAFPQTGGDQRLIDSRNQMRIEHRLNHVGRGKLVSSSRQTARNEWVDALNELNSANIDEISEFNVSCLYSLLRLNPGTCM